MKCPNCEAQHPQKEGMRCKCGYLFSLNPKTDRMADGRLLALAWKCSASGTYHFTVNQLHAAFIRKGMRKQFGCAIALFCLAAFMLFMAVLVSFEAGPKDVRGPYIIGFIVIVIVGIGIAMLKYRTSAVKFQQIVSKLDRGDIKKKMPLLVEKTSLHSPPPQWSESDLHDYGVERILIVQHDLNVDWFVKNGFHANQKMLVISQSGYPEYLMPALTKIIQERPDLPIFILHDATPDGLEMRSRVEADSRFAVSGHPLVDLGLTLDDTKRVKKLNQIRGAYRNGTPLDAVPNLMLFSALEVAFVERVALGELIANQHSPDGSGSFG